MWQVLPSVGDKKKQNFAFAGRCTLSEYFPSSFKERNDGVYIVHFAYIKLRSYWATVHQIYAQHSQIIVDKLCKSQWRYTCNPFRNARATNKGE